MADMDNVINLVQKNYTKDEIGQEIETETLKQVFCTIDSVSRNEWNEASQLGLRPEYRMTMFYYDYSNEDEVEFENQRFKVYRTYRNEDLIELYVEKLI